MFESKIDEALKPYLIKEGYDIIQYKQFSEMQKSIFSKNMVDSMFNLVLEKYNNADFEIIEKSKGDIERLKGYNDILECIYSLQELRRRDNVQLKDLDIVTTAIDNIKKYKKQWELAFKLNKGVLIMLYKSVVTSIICSVSFFISSYVEYIKDVTGSYDTKLYEQNDKLMSYPTIFIKNLEQFNKLSLNGDLAKFFQTALSKQGFVGIEVAVGIGISVIGLCLIIIEIIRELIYQFYYMRVSIAEHLKMQSQYLELNKTKLISIKGTKDIQQKQEKIATFLIKFADKINVDQKIATKKAETEIKKQNNKINISDVASSTEVSSNYGNLL